MMRQDEDKQFCVVPCQSQEVLCGILTYGGVARSIFKLQEGLPVFCGFFYCLGISQGIWRCFEVFLIHFGMF